MRKICTTLIASVILLPLCVLFSYGQAKTRKFSTIINHPSVNVYSPIISADGNAIVFISDNTQDAVLTPFYSFKDNGDWREPQQFPKTIYSRLNSLTSFGWSADGKKLFFSTLKSPGVGGFDIWTTEWNGTSWSDPVNPGLPINTQGNEGSPTITADGTTLYFTRCTKMDQTKAAGCKIFRSVKKPNGQWGEPVELPASVNSGNAQSPKIMADAETLIFSSDQVKPNRGGLDLYQVKFVDGNWTKPTALDFVNTEKDDHTVSVTALGRYLIRDTPGAKRNEIIEYLIPDDLRSRGMMKVDGKVSGEQGEFVPNYISAIDLKTNQRVFSGRSYPDGSFVLYLKEGTRYELSVDSEKDNMTFFSKTLDLTSDRIPQSEKVNVVLKAVKPGDEIVLAQTRFVEYSSALDQVESASEISKLTRLIKANNNLLFELAVEQNGFVSDTIQSSDLTEVAIDTTAIQIPVDIDSLGQAIMKDTFRITTHYHNDRTKAQAEAIVNALIAKGVSPKNLAYITKRETAVLPEDRKLQLKLNVKALPVQ